MASLLDVKGMAVQFAMNRHHGNGATDSSHSDTVEGEKCKILPSRQKKCSLVQDCVLPNIQETDEGQGRRENHNSMTKREDRRWRNSSFDSFNTENMLPRENGEYQVGGVSHGTTEEYPHECIGEVLKGREFGSPEMRIEGGVDTSSTVTNTPDYRNCPRDCLKSSGGASHSDKVVLTGLDLCSSDASGNRSKKMETRSNGSSSSTKTRANDANVKRDTDASVKYREIKCTHHATTSSLLNHKDHLNKILKWQQRSLDTDPEKCVICEITEATAKFASVESNRLLLEIVYPHEFYDKYSRSGKKAQNATSETKDSIAIVKPVKVARKPRRERLIPPPPPLSDRNNPPNTAREQAASELDSEISPEKKRRRELSGSSSTFKKEIHVQCKLQKSNALVITDRTDGQKMVLKGLKGWILKKDGTCKDKLHNEIKQSLYQVSALGMQFSIPEYNRSLSFRKPSSPRDLFNLTTPRPLERSYTQMSRGLHLGNADRSEKTRDSISSQREPTSTFIPKLFSRSATEGHINYGLFNQNSGRGNGKHSTIEADTRMIHLPPINSDAKHAVLPGKHHV